MRARPHNEPSADDFRKAILNSKKRTQLSTPQKPLPAAPVIGMRRMKSFAMRRPQIPLHQQADAVRAATVRPDGIHTVSVVEHDFETVGRRAIQNAAAHAAKPVARLLLKIGRAHV